MLSSFLAQQGLQRVMRPCSSCCCGGKARWKVARKRSPCRSDSHLCPLLDRERRKKFPAAGLLRAILLIQKVDQAEARKSRRAGKCAEEKNFLACRRGGQRAGRESLCPLTGEEEGISLSPRYGRWYSYAKLKCMTLVHWHLH